MRAPDSLRPKLALATSARTLRASAALGSRLGRATRSRAGTGRLFTSTRTLGRPAAFVGVLILATGIVSRHVRSLMASGAANVCRKPSKQRKTGRKIAELFIQSDRARRPILCVVKLIQRSGEFRATHNCAAHRSENVCLLSAHRRKKFGNGLQRDLPRW